MRWVNERLCASAPAPGSLWHLLEPIVAPLLCIHRERGRAGGRGGAADGCCTHPSRCTWIKLGLLSLRAARWTRVCHLRLFVLWSKRSDVVFRTKSKLDSGFGFCLKGQTINKQLRIVSRGCLEVSLPCWNITLQQFESHQLGLSLFASRAFDTPVTVSFH